MKMGLHARDVLVIIVLAAAAFARGNYRIAVSHDGNAHDPDDIVGAPLAIAIIVESGMKDNFVFMDYSNHIWGDTKNQADEMRESVQGACSRWGVDVGKTFEARKPEELAAAKDTFKAAAIDAYNDGVPLYYACGGPMEVPYQMVSQLEEKYQKNITVISHSPWNENHQHDGSHQWSDLIKLCNSKRIRNQNATIFLNTYNAWHWLRDMGGKYEWLYNRAGAKDRWDGSDAGMVYYIVTGLGDENPSMADFEAMIQSGNGDPTGDETMISAPATGTVLNEGETYTLQAAGVNIQWSYDVESDDKGEVSIGTGSSVQFTIPEDVSDPRTITITAQGDNGSDSRTYSIVSGGNSGPGGDDPCPGTTTLVCGTSGGVAGGTANNIMATSVGGWNPGLHFYFANIDFGTGYDSAAIKMGHIGGEQTVELRAGSASGTPLAAIPVSNEGWSPTVAVGGGVTGVQNLYVVKADGTWGNAEELKLVCAPSSPVTARYPNSPGITGSSSLSVAGGRVQVNASGPFALKVYDLRGKLAFTHRGHGQAGITLPRLGMNTYILSLEHDGTTKRRRFSLQGSR
jgi:hypothetical protein